jgi:hypothetical protein
MEFLVLGAIALFSLLVYFYWQRQHDHVWRSFRRRHLDKVRRPPSQQPLDPNFQFDKPDDGKNP